MPKKVKKESVRNVLVNDLVTVAFAEDMDLAKQYKQLLAEHDIPASIKHQPEMAQNGFSDIAILVPDSLLDEAHSLISEQDSRDDFFEAIFADDNRDPEGYDRCEEIDEEDDNF